jgi:hypothetical protein
MGTIAMPVKYPARISPLGPAGLLVANRLLGDALIVTRAMQASTIAEIFVDERQVRVELRAYPKTS